jgi:hypothetical protein
MHPRTTIPTLVGALALGALAWFALRPARIPSAWLTVEAPRLAAVGRPLIVRVTTNAATPPGVVTVDLHWTTVHDENRGFLSGASAQPVTAGKSPLTFSLPVPSRDELGSVRAVIYAGSTHRWADRVAAVTSDPLRVVAAAELGSSDAELRSLAVFDQRSDPVVVRQDSTVVQVIVAFVWAACGVGWWRRGMASQPSGHTGQAERVSWRAPALACLIVAVWETLPLEGVIGDWARAYFISHRWYGGRTGLQLALTCMIVMTIAVSSVAVWCKIRDGAGRCTWLGVGAYAALTGASLLSLHEVDVVLAKRVFAISTLQLGQLAVSGFAFVVLASKGSFHQALTPK